MQQNNNSTIPPIASSAASLQPDGKRTISALEAAAAELSSGRKPLSRYELCARLLLDERDAVLQRKPEDVDAAIAAMQRGE